MRIVFLGSSLALGLNGVGDYTRTLAGELERCGHRCLCIGLADTEDALDDRDPVVRLDRRRAWPQRIAQARAAVAAFAPDWVSLQFVTYAWHPRGFAFGLANRIATLLAGRRRHLMFHELWVGLDRNDTFANRIQGMVQRTAIRRLHRGMRPDCVHTQTPAYVAALASAGIAARQLPLFGNLPVAEPSRSAARRNLLAEVSPQIQPEAAVVAGWFGTIHPQWNGIEMITRLANAARAASRPLVLLALGRNGPGGAALAERLRKQPIPGVYFHEIGELPAEEASRVLGYFDVFLTPNPVALAPKSGTVAASLDHGIPVLISRNNWQPRGNIQVPPPADPLLMYSPPGSAVDLGAILAARRPAAARLPAVAAQFFRDIESIS